VRAILKSPDGGKLIAADYSVGSKQLGGDDAAPFRVRIPGGKLKRRGKSSVIASVTLVDGREQTIDERVKRC
jgi:hypothetical protein